MFPIRPVKGNVIIRPATEGETWGENGLIYRPKAYRFDCLYGEVVAVGPGEIDPRTKRRIPPGVEVGDVVAYAGYWQGEEIEHEGERYRVLSPESLIGVVEDPTAEIEHTAPL